MLITFLVKASILSFLWTMLSGLYMMWTSAPVSEKNTAIVFGPTVFMFAMMVIYGVVVL